MAPPVGRTIDLEYANSDDIIYTARAGLVPIMKVAKKLRLRQAVDKACADLRHESYVDYPAHQLVMLLGMGLLSGLFRVHQILQSAELPFLARLVGLARIPAATTFARFFERFDEPAIDAFAAINRELASRNTTLVGGYHVLVHDQSALQKYGTKMEGVEKGYGGTLKRGSLMLQSSLVVDAGLHTILGIDIRKGSTSSFSGATAQMNAILPALPKMPPGSRLVLADTAYGAGEYMRMLDGHGANFIVGVRNDAWMKREVEALDMQRFTADSKGEGYGYRDFIADRKAWRGDAETAQLFDDDWDGSRRVVVIRLPRKEGEPQKFLFLATSFDKDVHTAEEVHTLYRKHREAVELVNDEVQNQLGLSELPSHMLDANRAVAQVVALAWNLQRHVEHVGMEKERKAEAIRRGKMKIEESRKQQRRFEWWTMFVRFITVGGRLKTGKNRLTVITSQNQSLADWADALDAFDWGEYAIR